MEIFIDEKQVECDRNTALSVSLSVTSLTDMESGRTGYTKGLSIASTAENRDVMGYAEQIHGRDMYHADSHTARVEADGAVIIEGSLVLASVRRNMLSGADFYDCNILGASRLWIEKTAQRTVSSLEDDFLLTLSPAAIMSSWTDSQAWIRFLPVCRSKYAPDYSGGHLTPAARVLSTEDYHPFLHVATLLRKIMAQAGYDIVSDFIDGEFFDSLYMSGRYPTSDTSLLTAAMDFKACKYVSQTAQADYLGRVYANPYAVVSTVGGIADSADPLYEKDGIRRDDVFSLSGCFASDGKRVVFRPLKEVSVSFKYEISYTTSYRIASRNELSGFNRIYLGENFDRQFRLVNGFTDRRQEFCAGREFRIVIFDHKDGDSYRLYCSDGQMSIVVDDDIASRSKKVSIDYDGTVSNPTLYIKSGSSESVYRGDWALYDGYVSETGTMDVNISLHSGMEVLTPSSPKFFDDIYFGGAEPGMTFTLKAGTCVSPVFSPHPTVGSQLDWASVAAYRNSQKSFIDAIRHMFALCMYTDAQAGVVYIEPAVSFFDTDQVTDWTSKIDFSRPIAVQEIGAQNQAIKLCYRSGDSAVADFNRRGQDDFGAWIMSASDAAQQVEVSENALFSAAINMSDVYSDAPSASLVMVGDGSSEQGDLNFTPKIVRYMGMRSLPDGECWGWPSYGNSYPCAAFHSENDPFTLCFEDRDSCRGLNRFYSRNLDALRRGRRVTLYLNLDAVDIEPLIRPSQPGADFRSRYRLDIEGETGYYILEEVCDYTPSQSVTKCKFIKID